MKKLRKWFDGTLFDVASGITVLAFYGISALAVIAVIALVILAIGLIAKALKKNRVAEQAAHAGEQAAHAGEQAAHTGEQAVHAGEQKVTYDNSGMGATESGEWNADTGLNTESPDIAGTEATEVASDIPDRKEE